HANKLVRQVRNRPHQGGNAAHGRDCQGADRPQCWDVLVEIPQISAEVLNEVDALPGTGHSVDRLHGVLREAHGLLIHLDVDRCESIPRQPFQASPSGSKRRLVKHRLNVNLGIVHLLDDPVKPVLQLPKVVLELLGVNPKRIAVAENLLAALHVFKHGRIRVFDSLRILAEPVGVYPQVKLLLVDLLLHVVKRVKQVLPRLVELSASMLLVYVWLDPILVAAALGATHLAPNIPLSLVTEVLSFWRDLQADST